VAEMFRSLLNRSQALPVYLPEFDRYLLDYPKIELRNSETAFYWEKVNFGLKPGPHPRGETAKLGTGYHSVQRPWP